MSILLAIVVKGRRFAKRVLSPTRPPAGRATAAAARREQTTNRPGRQPPKSRAPSRSPAPGRAAPDRPERPCARPAPQPRSAAIAAGALFVFCCVGWCGCFFLFLLRRFLVWL